MPWLWRATLDSDPAPATPKSKPPIECGSQWLSRHFRSNTSLGLNNSMRLSRLCPTNKPSDSIRSLTASTDTLNSSASYRSRQAKERLSSTLLHYHSVKGSNNLDGGGLATLKSLFVFREAEARRQRRPPFRVLPDHALTFLAANPTISLEQVPDLGSTGLARFGHALQKAIQDGQAAPPVVRERRPSVARLTSAEAGRLQGLKNWRVSLGASLTLDPALLWPMVSLERLARSPNSIRAEIAAPGIRRWQREHVASSLRACLAS